MEDRIKSALEKAMERADALGSASVEDLKRMEHTPAGGAIAARYLRREFEDLLVEVNRSEADVREYVLSGVETTLVKNLTIPRDARARDTTLRALEGIRALKGNTPLVEEIADRIKHLLTYYEGAFQQGFFNFKQDFERRLPPEAQRALEMQVGPQWQSHLERLPQFQEEWRRARQSLDAQYEQALQEQKTALLG